LAPGSIAVLEGGRFVNQSEFAPMLPNDDQLVPYGLDSTVSISRSLPPGLQSTKVETVEILSTTNEKDGQKRPIGCTLSHRKTKTTKYVVKNNSTDRVVEKFYIDHTADVMHGGFVIQTTSNCIKSVMGFSRFEFKLEPQKEVGFFVTEIATYKQDLTNSNDLINFINHRAPPLLEEKVLDKSTLSVLKSIVKRQEVLAALSQMEHENFSDRDVQKWKAGPSVPSEPKEGLIEPTLLAKVIKALEVDAKQKEVRRTIASFNDHIKTVFQNQTRLRENIKSLDKMVGSDLVKRYLKDLDKEEDDLIQTRQSIGQHESESAKLEKDLKEIKMAVSLEARKIREAL